jgi:hypothetical protein
VKKSIPDTMFTDRDQVRLSAFSNWVLDHGVTEIVMTERQFWNCCAAARRKAMDDHSWVGCLAFPICPKAVRSSWAYLTNEDRDKFDERPQADGEAMLANDGSGWYIELKWPEVENRQASGKT